MKKSFFCFCAMMLTLCAAAQKKELMVKTGDKGLYLEHKVAPKESFFAIGRMYNISPKSLATYNELDINKGLLIDQKLRIPLTDSNFSQQSNSGAPVYFEVGVGDGFKKSTVKYNVSPEKFRYWNNLPSDNINNGDKLIVGFLQNSTFASINIDRPENAEVKTEVKTEGPPVVKTDQKPEPQKTPEEKTPVVSTEEKPAVSTEEKPAVSMEEKVTQATQGYFKSHFEQQVRIIPATKNETVTSGVFKTESGWSDQKYYLLIDKVPPGTIIRIINPTNNKSVYAKVLGEMSGIRQNEGLNIRISNAAASALEIIEPDKFIVNVNY